jgi:hypothetical protein
MKADARVRTLFVATAIVGCAPPPCGARYGFVVPGTAPTFAVSPSSVTPGGIRFDPTGQAIAGETIDRLTSEVSECLGMSIDRASFRVKVPRNWALSCDKTQQVLPVLAPNEGCDAKGLTDRSCPCRWRAFIQCPNVIIATPSLYLYKDALIRLVTGNPNPWGDPRLAKCAAPTTEPT